MKYSPVIVKIAFIVVIGMVFPAFGAESVTGTTITLPFGITVSTTSVIIGVVAIVAVIVIGVVMAVFSKSSKNVSVVNSDNVNINDVQNESNSSNQNSTEKKRLNPGRPSPMR